MSIYVHVHIHILLCICTYTHTHTHTLTRTLSVFQYMCKEDGEKQVHDNLIIDAKNHFQCAITEALRQRPNTCTPCNQYCQQRLSHPTFYDCMGAASELNAVRAADPCPMDHDQRTNIW